jgi:hypothetical protein
VSIEKAKEFMNAMENRDLKAASSYLLSNALIIFPGGKKVENLKQITEWSKTRYKFVRKKFLSFDQIQDGTLSTIYSIGTLHGEWLDGSRFDEIRFVDRFTFSDGMITELQVWNDLSEFRRGG